MLAMLRRSRLRAQLTALVNDELAPAVAQRLRQAVAADALLQRELQALERSVALLERLPAVPAPDSLRAAVNAALDAADPLLARTSELLENSLPAADRAVLQAAFVADPAAAERLAAVRRTVDLLHQLPPVTPRPGLRAAVLARLEPAPPRRWAAAPRLAWAGATAVVLLLGYTTTLQLPQTLPAASSSLVASAPLTADTTPDEPRRIVPPRPASVPRPAAVVARPVAAPRREPRERTAPRSWSPRERDDLDRQVRSALAPAARAERVAAVRLLPRNRGLREVPKRTAATPAPSAPAPEVAPSPTVVLAAASPASEGSSEIPEPFDLNGQPAPPVRLTFAASPVAEAPALGGAPLP
ncbi:MAG: hypothetical protein IT204_22450 [Fimbriimonadaceae bacterium]|nr:hypothetical protein [Fimbriimonadaceae bacterium]